MKVMPVAELGKRPGGQRSSLATQRLPPQGSAFVTSRLCVEEQEDELEGVREPDVMELSSRGKSRRCLSAVECSTEPAIRGSLRRHGNACSHFR